MAIGLSPFSPFSAISPVFMALLNDSNTVSPHAAAPCPVYNPALRPINVTVMLACTTSPLAAPVVALSPEGTSTANIGSPERLQRAITLANGSQIGRAHV